MNFDDFQDDTLYRKPIIFLVDSEDVYYGGTDRKINTIIRMIKRLPKLDLDPIVSIIMFGEKVEELLPFTEISSINFDILENNLFKMGNKVVFGQALMATRQYLHEELDLGNQLIVPTIVLVTNKDFSLVSEEQFECFFSDEIISKSQLFSIICGRDGLCLPSPEYNIWQTKVKYRAVIKDEHIENSMKKLFPNVLKFSDSYFWELDSKYYNFSDDNAHSLSSGVKTIDFDTKLDISATKKENIEMLQFDSSMKFDGNNADDDSYI